MWSQAVASYNKYNQQVRYDCHQGLREDDCPSSASSHLYCTFCDCDVDQERISSITPGFSPAPPRQCSEFQPPPPYFPPPAFSSHSTPASGEIFSQHDPYSGPLHCFQTSASQVSMGRSAFKVCRICFRILLLHHLVMII